MENLNLSSNFFFLLVTLVYTNKEAKRIIIYEKNSLEFSVDDEMHKRLCFMDTGAA